VRKINVARYIRLIKQGLMDYRWLLFYIQRMDYNPNHRRFISSVIAKFLPKTPNHQPSTEEKKLSENLKENGVVIIDNLVNKTQIEEMRAYLSTKICVDPQRPEDGKFTSPEFAHKSSVHGYYSPEDTVSIPHIWELANDPKILSILEDRFGAKPTISLVYAWWVMHGFDIKENLNQIHVNSPGEFHRDIDDWSQIRLFIYLTDVDEDAGPHAFIKTSHKWFLPPKKRALDITNPDFPIKDNLIVLNAEAGLAFLEDTYVLHRGIIPINKHRLMLTVTYTFFPVPYAPKAPLLPCPDKNRFDPYINKIYLKFK
jgi:ectoine hydroxylase-related dioxygenase (phytanoyl-CoA dioxygenase family)